MSVIAKFRKAQAGVATLRGPETQGPEGPGAGSGDPPALSAMDRSVKARRITPARVAMAAGVLALAGVGAWGYVRFGLQPTLAVSLERVTVSEVRQATFSDYVPVNGVVAPRNTVFLDTVEGGQVTEVAVEDGASVTAGQALARLKNTRLELEVLGREAQIAESQNYLANARLAFQQSELRNRRDMMNVQREIDRTQDQLNRERPLMNEGVAIAVIRNLEADLAHLQEEKRSIEASQEAERTVAQRNLAQLGGSIQRMTDSLALVRGNLDNLTVAAPIAGQLTGFRLNVGEVIGPGQRIGQVDTVDAWKVAAMVDEYYLGRIQVGQAGSFEMGGRTYALKVARVYPDVRDRQFAVDLEFTGAWPQGLSRGQTLRPRIELGDTAGSLIVANGPYYDETGGRHVMVMSADGKSAARREVTLGRRNPDAVEVVSGLRPGDRVITSSYEAFKDVERLDFN
jgi:HlyD family secretion protein